MCQFKTSYDLLSLLYLGLKEFSVEDQMNLFRGGWSEIMTLVSSNHLLPFNSIQVFDLSFIIKLYFFFQCLICQSREPNHGQKVLRFAPNLCLNELLAHICGMEDYFSKVRL